MSAERHSRSPESKEPANTVVPLKYSGQWIAWNRDRTRILGGGPTIEEAQTAARAAGEALPGYEWVPPADRRIVGRSR